MELKVVFSNDVLKYENLMYIDACDNVGKAFKKIRTKFNYSSCTLDSFVNLIKFYNFIKLINDRITLEYFDEEIFTCNVDELKEKIIEFTKEIENED